MKFRGGHVFKMLGSPPPEAEAIADSSSVILPTSGLRLNFSEVDVAHNDTVKKGDVLAHDKSNYSLPLIAPCGGTVDLESNKGHITIAPNGSTDTAPLEAEGVERLVKAGVWQFITDVRKERIADPKGECGVLVISLTSFEPFASNVLALATNAADRLVEGVLKLRELLGNVRTVVIAEEGVEAPTKDITARLVEGGAELAEVKARYPFGSPLLAARRLKLGSKTSDVWAVSPTGAVAACDALKNGEYATKRFVSVAGAACTAPKTFELNIGYPIKDLLTNCEVTQEGNTVRVIGGGVFTGVDITKNVGVGIETDAITLLTDDTPRKFMEYFCLNIGRRSFMRTGIGALRPPFEETVDTGVLGERRPCVQCGSCASVCPAGLMPGLIHRTIYAEEMDEVKQNRVDLCISCGLCSYFCTSKIELMQQFKDAKAEIRKEEEAL